LVTQLFVGAFYHYSIFTFLKVAYDFELKKISDIPYFKKKFHLSVVYLKFFNTKADAREKFSVRAS
jgi:hypothetical protein